MPPAAPGIAMAVSSPGGPNHRLGSKRQARDRSRVLQRRVRSPRVWPSHKLLALHVFFLHCSRPIDSTKDNPVSVVSGFCARRARSVAFQCFPQFSIALPIEQLLLSLTIKPGLVAVSFRHLFSFTRQASGRIAAKVARPLPL